MGRWLGSTVGWMPPTVTSGPHQPLLPPQSLPHCHWLACNSPKLGAELARQAAGPLTPEDITGQLLERMRYV